MVRILEICRWKFPCEKLESVQNWRRGVLYSFSLEYKIVFMWLLFKKEHICICGFDEWSLIRLLSQELRNCSQIFPVRINI